MNFPEPSAHGLPSVSWDVIFALVVGLGFIFGSVGVVVGQNVVLVVAKFFHFWRVRFYIPMFWRKSTTA